MIDRKVVETTSSTFDLISEMRDNILGKVHCAFAAALVKMNLGLNGVFFSFYVDTYSISACDD